MHEFVQLFSATAPTSESACQRIDDQIEAWQDKMDHEVTIMTATPALASGVNNDTGESWVEMCVTVLFHRGRPTIEDAWIEKAMTLLREGINVPQEFAEVFAHDTEQTFETALHTVKLLLDTGVVQLSNGKYTLSGQS